MNKFVSLNHKIYGHKMKRARVSNFQSSINHSRAHESMFKFYLSFGSFIIDRGECFVIVTILDCYIRRI